MTNSVLFEDATIITWNDQSSSFKIRSPASLLTKNDRIAGIYDSSDSIQGLPDDVERVRCKGKIISPGFIDTHRHGWQTAFRTIGANTTLPEYFFRYSQFASQTSFSAEDIYIGQLTGLYECINSGVTTTVDHAHHTWSDETGTAGLDGSIDSGVRVFWCYTFHPLESGYDHEAQVANFEKLLKHDKLSKSPSQVGVAFDAFAKVPAEVSRSVVDTTIKNRVPVFTTHSLGGPWVIDNGPSVLDKAGLLRGQVPVIISHASFMSQEDIKLLRDANQYVSITPESEMHYGHDHEHNHKIMDQCALGVDTHFTFSTDMVTQARLWLQAVRRGVYRETLAQMKIGHPNPFDVEQAFYLATNAGGLALRRDDLGAIKVGAKADIVVFDGDSANMLGWVDPIAAILLHSNVADVRHVLVDGKWRKKDGALMPAADGSSWDAIKEKFLESAKAIQQKWLSRPLPTIEGNFFGLTPYKVIDKAEVQKSLKKA